MLTPWMLVLAACVALWVDRRWGEPPLRWHPVAALGHYLTWMGERIAPQAGAAPNANGAADWRAFGRGAVAWCGGAAFVTALAWGLQDSLVHVWGLTDPDASPWFKGAGQVCTAVALGVCLKPMLAWRMLEQEVQAVDAALHASLAQGRERLSWLCSRDTHALTEEQVRETAVESLAENLNDSVVAPLFWFACLGLPGAVLYRFANTADAMWGYRGERDGRVWEWAGKWAARCDDVLSWVPARITACALMVSASCKEGRALWTQAQCTPSPNSGWPMAAMALALQVRLGKPGVYALNPQGQPVTSAHVAQACYLAHQTVRWAVGAWAAVVLLIGGAHA